MRWYGSLRETMPTNSVIYTGLSYLLAVDAVSTTSLVKVTSRHTLSDMNNCAIFAAF